ncbi:tetratricopeptide repeat protein [Aestuariibius sp. 2305UL40-4]|uniref:tetratricopeptide repeat protein n=1 Tax=Aestuariibius violaceus TaxID=3234132 RepID=UPI00345E5EB3
MELSRRTRYVALIALATLAVVLIADRRGDTRQAVADTCRAYSADAEAAIDACTTMLSWSRLVDDARAQTYSHRAAAHRSTDDFDAALADAQAGLNLAPDDALLLNERAIANYELGDLETALADNARALALDPDSAWILRWKGYLLDTDGRGDDALEFLLQAHDLRPADSWTQKRIVSLMIQADRFAEAEDFEASLLAEDPEATWASARLGNAYFDAENYPKAAAYLVKAVRRDPTDDDLRERFFGACIGAQSACPPLFPETRNAQAAPGCHDALTRLLDLSPDLTVAQEGDVSAADALQDPLRVWPVAAALFTADMIALMNGSPTRHRAERLILTATLYDCAQISEDLPALAAEFRKVEAEFDATFHENVRANVLDFAHHYLQAGA